MVKFKSEKVFIAIIGVKALKVSAVILILILMDVKMFELNKDETTSQIQQFSKEYSRIAQRG